MQIAKKGKVLDMQDCEIWIKPSHLSSSVVFESHDLV